jgi:hypothetical protein
MNSEKVLKKDYKKQTILTIIFFISLVSSILIYLYNEKIDGGLEIVFILLIVNTVIVSLCLISRLLSNNRLKKAIINYPDIYQELDNKNTIVFSKYGFYFTNKYFITSKNFNIFKYSDILWLYYNDRKNKKMIIGKDIVIGLNNGNIYNLWTINIKDINIFKKIEKEFKNRVENIIIGLNDKNKKKYDSLIKK